MNAHSRAQLIALKPLIDEEIRRRELEKAKLFAKDSYIDYCCYVHSGRFKRTKMAEYLCREVQEFIEKITDAPYDILIITVPPQHGKSMSVTETLPSWYLGKYQYNRVIEISYNDDFAKLFGRRNREKLSTYGPEIFGIDVSKKTSSVTEFELSNNIGGMISRGILGGVTGRPCNLMLIDDPVKNMADADSETKRNTVYAEWQSTYKTRFAAGAKVIIILTRWHEDDLAGRIIKSEKNVKVIALPIEAEENDPLGRAVGDALCPELGKNNKWLKAFKESYKDGARSWAALFMCRPSSAEGNLFKRDWWRFYEKIPQLAQAIISVDATFKGKDSNDYVAIQVWGKAGTNAYLVDLIKKHMGFNDTINAIKAMKAKHPQARTILIEDKANGSAIIEMLQKEMTGVIPVNPKGGKYARAHAVSGAVESGNVYLPKYAPFTDDFIEECAAFPNGAHDDQVDSMSQGLNRLLYYSGLEDKADEADDYDDFLNYGR